MRVIHKDNVFIIWREDDLIIVQKYLPHGLREVYSGSVADLEFILERIKNESHKIQTHEKGLGTDKLSSDLPDTES